jgi:hypothetical protein
LFGKGAKLGITGRLSYLSLRACPQGTADFFSGNSTNGNEQSMVHASHAIYWLIRADGRGAITGETRNVPTWVIPGLPLNNKKFKGYVNPITSSWNYPRCLRIGIVMG